MRSAGSHQQYFTADTARKDDGYLASRDARARASDCVCSSLAYPTLPSRAESALRLRTRGTAGADDARTGVTVREAPSGMMSRKAEKASCDIREDP